MTAPATQAPQAPRTPVGSRAQGMTPNRLARLTGALYVLLVGLGMLGPLTLESMLVPGDAAATADNIGQSLGLFNAGLGAWLVIVVVDVVISVTLYLLLAPVNRGHSLLAAAFRLVYSTALAALLVLLFVAHQQLTGPRGGSPTTQGRALEALETFSAGFLVALVFFGVHLILLGTLFHRSGYLPRTLSILLVAAGIGYVVDSLASLLVDGYGGIAAAVLLTPAVLGEVGLTLWLLVKGVRTPATTATP